MNLTEQIVDFRRVKARRVHVIAAELQIVEQIRQGDRLPFADRLVERDVQRFFFLRIFDMNDYAVDLRRAVSTSFLPSAMLTKAQQPSPTMTAMASATTVSGNTTVLAALP